MIIETQYFWGNAKFTANNPNININGNQSPPTSFDITFFACRVTHARTSRPSLGSGCPRSWRHGDEWKSYGHHMVISWWFNGDLMVIHGSLMVMNGDHMVIIWWLMAIHQWPYGDEWWLYGDSWNHPKGCHQVSGWWHLAHLQSSMIFLAKETNLEGSNFIFHGQKSGGAIVQKLNPWGASSKLNCLVPTKNKSIKTPIPFKCSRIEKLKLTKSHLSQRNDAQNSCRL